MNDCRLVYVDVCASELFSRKIKCIILYLPSGGVEAFTLLSLLTAADLRRKCQAIHALMRCIATACALLPRYKIACIWQLSSSCQPRQIFVQALDEARSRVLKGRKSVMGNGAHKVATRRTCQAIHALMHCIATACALLPRCDARLHAFDN